MVEPDASWKSLRRPPVRRRAQRSGVDRHRVVLTNGAGRQRGTNGGGAKTRSRDGVRDVLKIGGTSRGVSPAPAPPCKKGPRTPLSRVRPVHTTADPPTTS